MFFKKRGTNQNKIRYPGRKRKIIATIALSLSLLFGKTRLSSSQSSSPNFDNKVVQERIIDDQEFCSLEDNDQQVILAKTGDSGPSVPTSPGRGQPSNFPTPPAGGRPSRPVYVPKYRTAPKVVPGPGLGAGANPAGAGGGGEAAEFDDQCPVPENKKSQESKSDYDYFSNAPKKKKQSAEQCELDENVKEGKIKIVSRIKEDAGLVKFAEDAGKDSKIQRDLNGLIEQLRLGNESPGTGTKTLFKGVKEARARSGARVYFRKRNGNIEILAKSNKNPKDQKTVIKILRKKYG